MESKEKNTKEKILEEALKLFAQSGYMGTSMNEIASRLGVTKAALYKHYSSKQEILDSIVERMNQMDVKRAKEYEMPDGDMEDVIAGYKNIALEKDQTVYKSTVPALDGRRIFLLFPKNADIRTVQRSGNG